MAAASETWFTSTRGRCVLGWLRAVAIDATRGLGLPIGKGIVWRARSGRRIEARWALHVSRNAWLALLFPWRRSKSWTALTASHDALEQVCWAVTNGWRWRLRRRTMKPLRRTTALLEFMTKTGDFFLVPTAVSSEFPVKFEDTLTLF